MVFIVRACIISLRFFLCHGVTYMLRFRMRGGGGGGGGEVWVFGAGARWRLAEGECSFFKVVVGVRVEGEDG